MSPGLKNPNHRTVIKLLSIKQSIDMDINSHSPTLPAHATPHTPERAVTNHNPESHNPRLAVPKSCQRDQRRPPHRHAPHPLQETSTPVNLRQSKKLNP